MPDKRQDTERPNLDHIVPREHPSRLAERPNSDQTARGEFGLGEFAFFQICYCNQTTHEVMGGWVDRLRTLSSPTV
jgi:hypothetical protein